ncbi:MAG: hypothetical protein MHPSP_000587 [Paramarteilia canceri]
MVSYDTKTTTFSPEGKIYQVEYAMQAVNSAGLCFAIKGADSIVLLVQNKVISKLLDKGQVTVSGEEEEKEVFSKPQISTIISKLGCISDKLFQIDSHFVAATAGLAPDAHRLVQYLREVSLNNYKNFGEPVAVSKAVRYVADWKQRLTQHGGSRPFGVSLIYCGKEGDNLMLYSSDPSGNYQQNKATAIGNESSSVINELNTQLGDQSLDQLDSEKLLKLSLKVVLATIFSGSDLLNNNSLEAYVIKTNEPVEPEFEWEKTEPLDIQVLNYIELNNLIHEIRA